MPCLGHELNDGGKQFKCRPYGVHVVRLLRPLKGTLVLDSEPGALKPFRERQMLECVPSLKNEV